MSTEMPRQRDSAISGVRYPPDCQEPSFAWGGNIGRFSERGNTRSAATSYLPEPSLLLKTTIDRFSSRECSKTGESSRALCGCSSSSSSSQGNVLKAVGLCATRKKVFPAWCAQMLLKNANMKLRTLPKPFQKHPKTLRDTSLAYFVKMLYQKIANEIN